MQRNVFASGGITFRKNEIGGLSIFLSIVMFAVVVLTGLLVDISRIDAAANQTARALDLSVISMLAGYETDLKNEYGLFAVNAPYPDTAVLKGYIEKNLEIGIDGDTLIEGLLLGGSDRRARLFNYNIEQVALSAAMPLYDADVLERQILEYMKYKAPAALATGVAALIKQAATASKMADATKIKVEIDRKLGKIGMEQQNLRDYIHGDLKTTNVRDQYVLNFNKRTNRRGLADTIIEQYNAYTEAAYEHYEAEQSRNKSGNPDAEASKAEKDLIRELKGELRESFDALYERETQAYLNSNRGAAGCTERIAAASEEARVLYAKLDECMEKFTAEDRQTPFTQSFMEDVERGKASLIDAESAKEKIGQLNENIDVITRALNGMNELSRDLFGYSPPGSPVSASVIMQKLLPDTSSYHYDISYEYQKVNGSGSFPDPREFVNDRVSELLGLDKDGKDKKLQDIGVDASKLPSRTMEPWYVRLMASFTEGEAFNFNKASEDGAFTTEALDSVINLGEVCADEAENMRNNLYACEYALSKFKNAVKDEYRWAGAAKPTKTAYFDAEVEYILHGFENQSGNIFWTRIDMLLTRFAMNFIHVHSDSRKLNMARNIAATMTAWWSSGSLIAPVADVIIAAWSLKEAVADVEDLLDGKRVPFIKLAGDWKTNIGVSAEGQPKTREEMKWSYIDYLRIYLLMLRRETKLGRINDLIEINTKFAGRALKVRDLYCALDGELTASVNYLFMTSAFMPQNLKTSRQRHILRASASRDLF